MRLVAVVLARLGALGGPFLPLQLGLFFVQGTLCHGDDGEVGAFLARRSTAPQTRSMS